MSENEYWLGFSLFHGIGPKRFAELLKYFGSAKDAWEADAKELEKVIGKVFTSKFKVFRSTFSFAEYKKKLREKQVSFVALCDKDYPALLKRIVNPPLVLYFKGTIHYDNTYYRSVGVVGTRKITNYGREVTEMITTDLVQAGCVIVSGLALGVDAVAHKAALDNEGKTIAVLGCGVDLCYPPANENLYNSILQKGGAIVSEYPIGQPPSVGSFPSRNRIIAGLSEAVVVTQGAEDSGALITAEEALKNGRKVFAVPGPITSSLSKGPFKLIAKGAKLVTSGGDILTELKINANPPSLKLRRAKGETKEEQEIIDLLQNEALLFDEIMKRTRLTSETIGSLLSLMEIKGLIKSGPQGAFSLVHS